MRPNPWVWLPVGFALGAGAVIGWVVTRVGCLPRGCPGWQVTVALLTGLAAAAGVLVVVVLVVRSLAEWRRSPTDPEREEGRDS